MKEKGEVGVKGIIIVDKRNDPKQITEKLKAQVNDEFVKFPKELGVEHPFNFEDMEKVYKKVGFAWGMVNKYVNAIVGEAQVTTNNENATTLLRSFIKESNLKIHLREWIIEALAKGNGFMEIDFETNQLRVINANNMYVVRDEEGEVIGYNQYLGAKKNFSKDKIIPFTPDQIAHLPVNKIADSAYGYGLLYPNERVIENIVSIEQDWHKLISRKAGMPIHIAVGQPGEVVKPALISSLSSDLQYLTNRTEWVTDGNVKISAIDFKGIGDNLLKIKDDDLLMWSYGTLIPQALLGNGNLPEGLAKTNENDWNRVIASLQEEIEEIIEDKIFRPYLLAQNPKWNVEIDFSWNLPTEDEINARLTQLLMIVNSMTASPNLKRYAELEIAKLLEFENADKILRQPEMGLDEEKEREEKLQQPEVPGAKPSAAEKQVIESLEDESNLSVKEFVDLKEIQGFNYQDYLLKILQTLQKDKFTDLRAIDEQQLRMGLLSDSEIDKLRVILKQGFQENKTIREIEAQIRKEIPLKDRLDKENNLLLSAEARPNMIARSETVRLANQGLVNLYQDNGIEQVRWLAAVSPRTCPLCLDLNGQVFKIKELQVGVNQPPLHPSCRCSLLSVVE